MIGTEAVFLGGCQLRQDSGLKVEVMQALRALVKSEDYEQWAQGLGQVNPYEAIGKDEESVLGRAGLAHDGRLLVRVNEHRGKLFATDGVWVDPRWRVFPYCDESEALFKVAQTLGWMEEADTIIDLATGCGHTAWAWEAACRIGYDINPRAVAYAEMNRTLNSIGAKARVGMNDITEGLGGLEVDGLTGNVVVTANMPFGPAPTREALPLTSNGGTDGLWLQRATLYQIKNLSERVRGRARVKALVMGFSAGDRQTGRWELNELAKSCLPQAKVGWVMCDDKVMRVDGRRRYDNPCRIEDALVGLGSCRVYTPNEEERSRKKEMFRELAMDHMKVGNVDLAYGVACLEMN